MMKKQRTKVKKAAVSSAPSGDLSNRTVLIVLLVVILVSVISLVWYLSALRSVDMKPRVVVEKGPAQAEVGITIMSPEQIAAAEQASNAAQAASTSAEVGLTIMTPEQIAAREAERTN